MKQNFLLIFLMVALVVNVVNMAGVTRAENIVVANRFGAGIHLNVLNLSLGPSLEYWLTDNFGVLASVGALFDYTSFGLRGYYLLNRRLNIAGYPARPYVGVGFAFVKGPDYNFGAGSVKQDGSGAEIYAGLLHSASYLMKNLYVRGEIVLSTLTIETTGETVYGDRLTHEEDWGFFSFGGGIVYYF